MTNPRIALWFAVAVSIPACGKSKADQCSAVIAGYNTVSETVRKGIGDGTDPVLIENSTTAIEEASRSFETVEVSDAKVKVVQGDLTKAFDGYTAKLKQMASLVRDAKDPAKAEAATAKIVAIAADFETTKTALVNSKQALMSECGATAQ